MTLKHEISTAMQNCHCPLCIILQCVWIYTTINTKCQITRNPLHFQTECSIYNWGL